MTCNREVFINLQPCSLELVTFGDGGKGTVLGSGSLKVPSMPKLENVLPMDGLKVNLISISQLCDDNLFVQFTKGSGLITNYPNLCVIKGKRSPENCYLLALLGTCYTTLINNSDIWHRRLGHISPRCSDPRARPDPIGKSEPKPQGRSVLFPFIFRVIKFSFSKVVATRIPGPTRMADHNWSPVYSDVFIYLIKTFY